MFFAFGGFQLVVSQLKMASKHNAKVLSSVLSTEGHDVPYGEKMHVR